MEKGIRLVLILTLVVALFAFMSGTARGFHHASRDYHYASKAAEWFSAAWYDGGMHFNQSYPWTADFTHCMMHLQVLFLAFAAATFAFLFPRLFHVKDFIYERIRHVYYTTISIWTDRIALVLFVWFLWFMEGRGFVLWYHVFLPNAPHVPSMSLGTYLVQFFIP